MPDNTNKQVYSEVYDIIKHMDINIRAKIPLQFIKIIQANKDDNYTVNIDYTKNINNQKLLKETRAILSLIYRDYICTPEERKILIEVDKEKIKKERELLVEKYNPDNIFKTNKNIQNQKKKTLLQENAIIEYKEKNFFKKIFDKVRHFFNK